jgi:hypothetical protein
MKTTCLRRTPWAWKPKAKTEKTAREPAKRRTLDDMGKRDLEKVLDKVYSEYIRKKAARQTVYVACATCGKIMAWNECDCGHYVSRAFRAVRWDERNTAPQCRRCNSFLGGMQHKMRQYLVGLHGELAIETVEVLATMGGETLMDAVWMREMIKQFRAKLKLLRD